MVGSILRLMLTRGLSIVRWNNFPRITDIKQLDNVGMTLHTALFLAHHEKALSKQKLDELYIIKKIVFSSFSDLVLSDINSGTKAHIKKIDPDIFQQLINKAFEYFLMQEAPILLRNDLEQTLSRKDRELEDTLILASKKYVAYCEAQKNALIYPFIYEIPLKEIQESFPEMSQKLKSFEFLLSDENSQKYLTHISRLMCAMRWNMRQRIYPISVMSHKVIVTYIVYILGMIGNQNGEQNDILSLFYRAIYHDVPELITGDIITPTKKSVPGFSQLLETVEKDMMEKYFFRYISSTYRDFISSYILRPFEGSEGQIAKYADILSAFFEAKVESQKGNLIFTEICKKIEQELMVLEHPGVSFFMNELPDDFMDEDDTSIPLARDI